MPSSKAGRSVSLQLAERVDVGEGDRQVANVDSADPDPPGHGHIRPSTVPPVMLVSRIG